MAPSLYRPVFKLARSATNALDRAATSPAAEAAVSAFVLFSDASNVPAIVELSRAVQALQERLKYSKHCKRECTGLANKCGEWAQAFMEWLKDVETEEELARTIADLIVLFQDMMKQVGDIASRSRWKLMWNTDKVKQEIHTTELNMKHLLELFKLKNTLEVNRQLDEMIAKGKKDLADLQELRADQIATTVKPPTKTEDKQFLAPIKPPTAAMDNELWHRLEAQPAWTPRNCKPRQDDMRTDAERARDERLIWLHYANVEVAEVEAAVDAFEARVGVRPVVPVVREQVAVHRDRVLHISGEVAGNAYSQVHLGMLYAKGERPLLVAVRRYVFNDEQIGPLRERFLCELTAWGVLNHPRIHRLCGIADDTMLTHTVIVSPWVRNGNITEYISKKPGGLGVRLRLLVSTAEGVVYLHSIPMVHGNLKGKNVLVSDEGEALITGFQRARMDKDPLEDKEIARHREAELAWQAPELAHVPWTGRRICTKFDVWSLGMIMYEVLAGRAPFHDTRGEMRKACRVQAGDQPARPLSPLVTDDAWLLMRDCWNMEPDPRPTSTEVLERLRAMLAAHEEKEKAGGN